MSFKQFLVLFFLFLVYLTLGAYMFYSIERPLEEERRAVAKAEALQIKGDVSSRVKKLNMGTSQNKYYETKF